MPDLDDDLIALERSAKWLEEWSDKDLGPCPPIMREKSLGYIAARQLRECAARLSAATEREQRLREALRREVVHEIAKEDRSHVFYGCELCAAVWAEGVEQHNPGCLAAAPEDRASPDDAYDHDDPLAAAQWKRQAKDQAC